MCLKAHVGCGSNQEWQIEAETRRRSGWGFGLDETRVQKDGFRKRGIHAYGQSDWYVVLQGFCRGHDVAAAGKCSLAAIVPGGGSAFSSLAAVGGFLREFTATTKAVERLEQQEDRYQADCDVKATAHSIREYQSSCQAGHVQPSD